MPDIADNIANKNNTSKNPTGRVAILGVFVADAVYRALEFAQQACVTHPIDNKLNTTPSRPQTESKTVLVPAQVD